MEKELKKSFSWEIENLFSDKNADVLESEPFSSGGCQWRLSVFPKGFGGGGHLTTRVEVYDPSNSLRLGWKRRVKFAVVFLNQSGKELTRAVWGDRYFMFNAEGVLCSFTVPLTVLEETGFLDTNKVTLQVYMKVFEAFDYQGKSTENDLISFNGVEVLSSQVNSLAKIHQQHPHFIYHSYPTNEERSVYFALFFCLMETLSKSPQSLSLADLTNAQVALTQLTKAGFKLDFFKTKLAEVSLERNNALPHGSDLAQRIKNVELTLSDLKAQRDQGKIKYASVAKVSSFQFINLFIHRFFLSCFSI